MLASKLRQVVVLDRVCASGVNLIMLAGFFAFAGDRFVCLGFANGIRSFAQVLDVPVLCH